MQPKHTDVQPTTLPPASGEDEQQVAQLVGALYAEMPASEQSRLLAHAQAAGTAVAGGRGQRHFCPAVVPG
jgi:hypothetical protein